MREQCWCKCWSWHREVSRDPSPPSPDCKARTTDTRHRSQNIKRMPVKSVAVIESCMGHIQRGEKDVQEQGEEARRGGGTDRSDTQYKASARS